MPQMAQTYDVIVIGAGIAGASLAARLAGKARVLILEMEQHPGYHASGRSAATYEPTYGPPVIRDLTLASGDFFRSPPDGFADVPLLAPRGVLMLGGPENGALSDEAVALGFTRIAFAEAKARIGQLRDGAAHYLFDDRAKDIDVEALHRGYLAMHRRSGGDLRTAVKLEEGKREGGVWRIATSAGAFEAPVLANAAGAWTDEVARRCGIAPIGLTPKRRSVCIVAGPTGANVMTWPLLATLRETFYCKPMGGKLAISPFDAVPSEPHDAFADDLLLAEGIAAFEGAVDHSITRIERSWGGLRTFAPDGDPVVGFEPTAQGFFWCAGQGGYGMQSSPALSAAAGALLLGQTSPYAAAMSPARFRK